MVNLNPPSEIADTSWIKPGKTSWDWWSGSVAKNVSFKTGMNTDTMKHYIDFSSQNGLEYMLIDAGWAKRGSGPNDSGSDLLATNPEIDMPALLDYAKQKKVRLWLWAHWTDVDRQMDEAFALFEKWGIAGVKIDFMDRDDQWMVNWYRRVAKKAAEHKLMLDFHGAYQARRPAAHLSQRPDARGSDGPRVLEMERPHHPEAQRVAGLHADARRPHGLYAGAFNNVTRAEFQPRNEYPMVMGTRAHETALYVVFESPFEMLADYPGSYQDQKEIDFLRAVPTTWDETRMLNGHPTDYITIARRRGSEWYVGSITDWNPREFDLPLSFLGSGSYTAEIYADAPDAATQPKNTVKESRQVDAKTVLKVKLAPGGGCAIRLRPR